MLAGLLLVEPARLSQAIAQVPLLQDDRFAGLQWTFVRIRYSAFTVDSRYRLDYWGEPWAIDAPAAEQNLSRRLRTATAIEVNDPIVLTLDDPKLWDQALDLHRRAGQPAAARQRGVDPARVPAARRHADASTTSTARTSGTTSRRR